MDKNTKTRIKERLAGVRFTVEENLSLVSAGVVFAHLSGQLDMLNIVERVLEDFLKDEDADDEDADE